MTCEKVRDLLSAYLDEELPESTARQVAAHLAECPACREELAGLRLTSHMLGSLPGPHLSTDLSAAVVARASVPGWKEKWAGVRDSLAPRKTVLVRQFGQAIAVFALFVVAAAAPDSRVGRLVVSWPCQVAGAAGTGMAQLTASLSEAQAFLDERAAISAAEQSARR